MNSQEELSSSFGNLLYKIIKKELEAHELNWFEGEDRLLSLSVVENEDSPDGIPWRIKAEVLSEHVRPNQLLSNEDFNIPSSLVIDNSELGQLPDEISGQGRLKIDVVVKAQKPYRGLSPSEVRPLTGGISSMNYKYKGPGTLGCVIRLKDDAVNYILSNWHVFANSNGELGDAILQPCRYDGGHSDKNAVGQLVWYRLDSYMDAAIARVSDEITIKNGTCCNTNFSSRVHPYAKMKIQKCGRSTGLTKGIIVDFPSTIRVDHEEYPNTYKVFKDQIKLKLEAEIGDSGAIVTTFDGNVVGLLFAGNLDGYCLANPLDFSRKIDNGDLSCMDDFSKEPHIESYN